MIRTLKTPGEVIDALGGPGAIKRLTGHTNQAVTNWRARGRLPSDTYLVFSDELRRVRCRAPAALWGIREKRRAS